MYSYILKLCTFIVKENIVVKICMSKTVLIPRKTYDNLKLRQAVRQLGQRGGL